MARGHEEPAARTPQPEALRAFWESGQRGRAVQAVLAGWDELLAAPEGLGWLQQALRECGLEPEAFALQAAAARRRPSTRDWESLIRSVLRSGDPWWARALIEEAGRGSRELQRLEIEARLQAGDDAVPIDAWIERHRDEPARVSAVEWYVRSGRIPDAERVLAGAPDLAVWRARFALWRGETDAARNALAGVAATPETRCIEAAAEVLDGQLAEAEPLLRALLDTVQRGEALTWLALLLRRQQRHAEAAEAAEQASYVTSTFNLVARLERELATDQRSRAEQARSRSRLGRLLWWRRRGHGVRPIADLEHADQLYTLGLRPDEPVAALETVLDRFGGNRTLHLTTLDGGRLVPHHPPPDPRFLGANVLRVLRTRGAAAARALYDTLASTVGDHPLFRIYAGELELWTGDYARAEGIFRDVLAGNPKVLWAWIGLGASLMLQGELAQAQRTWDEGVARTGFVGPTAYVYRGECYRRQGALAPARRELEIAVRNSPQRLSAWINLALLGDNSELVERVERECIAFAPLLMDELAGSPVHRLEQVLDAMRGNRRSTPGHITYHLWGRIWHRAAQAA